LTIRSWLGWVSRMSDDRRRTILFTLIAVNLLCAPISWVDDGVTPSWVVYPIVLLIAAWRVARGHGELFVAIAATVFWVVHLPWTWAALTGAGENPLDRESPSSPVQWLITLCLVPLVTAGVAWYLWRLGRREATVAA
jgi:hypothetical protein